MGREILIEPEQNGWNCTVQRKKRKNVVITDVWGIIMWLVSDSSIWRPICPVVVTCELQKHQTKSEMWLWRLFHTWYMWLETSVKFHKSCLWSLFLMWARMDLCNITLSSPYHHGNPNLWRCLSSVPCQLIAHQLHNSDLVPLFYIWKEILV